VQQPEPAELQILRQLLGHERGGDVFALYTMASSLAQMGQQVQQQAEHIQQMMPPTGEQMAPAPSANPWTAPHAPEPAETNGAAPVLLEAP
jgi:hypothetical protein